MATHKRAKKTRRRPPPPPRRRPAPPPREASAGFAIETYDQRTIEENAREKFGPEYGEPADRDEALQLDVVDPEGAITQRGWDQINDDVERLERNTLAWLRRKFPNGIRDEGHGGHDGNELIGTVWFDPTDLEQADLIDLAADAGGSQERIDMVDASYGGLADTAFDGVSWFGGFVLGGQVTFFSVEPQDMEVVQETMERWRREQRTQRAKRRRR